MIVEVIQAPYFGTNCWIFAPSRNSECFIIDPGIGGTPTMPDRIQQVLGKFGLKPIAVLLTHGHLDHTFSLFPLSDRYGIPAYIHGKDRPLLSDPWPALNPGGELKVLMAQLGASQFQEPAEVRIINDGEEITIAGCDIQINHAPGHTAGSAMFIVNGERLISGDVLFEGGIGRFDLPTGSASAMISTLKNKVLPLDDHLIVHPGHGGETTIGRERKNNPYLREEYLNGKWS